MWFKPQVFFGDRAVFHTGGYGGPGHNANDKSGDEHADGSRSSNGSFSVGHGSVGRRSSDGSVSYQTTFTRVGIEYGQKFANTYTDLQTIKERVIDVNNNNTWRDQLSVERNFDRWNDMAQNGVADRWSPFGSDSEKLTEQTFYEALEHLGSNPHIFRRPVVLDLDQNGLDLQPAPALA